MKRTGGQFEAPTQRKAVASSIQVITSGFCRMVGHECPNSVAECVAPGQAL